MGAGASIPFFTTRLTTSYLTNEIQREANWAPLVTRYTNIMRNVNVVRVNQIMDALGRIRQINGSLNFEQIIEIVDKISSFNFNPLPESKILHNILHYFGALPDRTNVWDSVPFLFRQLICELIVQLEENPTLVYNNLIDLQRGFIQRISENGGLNIFSLNYDEIIYDSVEGLDFTNGFVDQRFNLNTYRLASNVISFPHGHVRFSEDDLGVIYYPHGAIANQERFRNIGRSDLRRTVYLNDTPYSYSFNTFIVTGQSKESTFDKNPYSLYYQRFAHDTLRASDIYIIGYSFSDAHFNRMLLNYLTISDYNKLYVVDYFPGLVDVPDEFMSPNSLVNRMLTGLNVNSIELIPNNNQYVHHDLVRDLNTNGYGYIMPQVWFYKKGYDSFLNELGVLP